MRLRRVKRIFDNRTTQQRIVLELECRHYAAIGEEQPEFLRAQGGGFSSWPCVVCPDVPEEKTPRELWREAGEP